MTVLEIENCNGGCSTEIADHIASWTFSRPLRDLVPGQDAYCAGRMFHPGIIGDVRLIHQQGHYAVPRVCRILPRAIALNLCTRCSGKRLHVPLVCLGVEYHTSDIDID